MKTLKNRTTVIEQYAREAMEEMDMDDACTFITDTIEAELHEYTDVEVIDIIEGCHEHILVDQVLDTDDDIG